MLTRREVIFPTVISLLPFVLAACSDTTSSTDPRTQPPLVRIEPVESAVHSERSFTGIVAARVQSDLGFRVPGKVLERLVDAGQPVKRGQPLMRIDPTDLRLAMRAHEEAVAAAKARAHQTAEDEVRHRNLLGPRAVSVSEYEKTKAAADSARADLKTARAKADVARNEMSYAVLLADADGVVVETLAEPGQVVVVGQVVVRVAHAGRREAVIELPETLRPAIGSSGRASLYGSGLTGSAKLRQLSDAANRETRTFEARYVLEGPLADAPLGSTISMEISDGRSAPTLQVPIGAIFDSGKGPGVWLVERDTPQVTWRAVHIAGLNDEAASVLAEEDRCFLSLGEHALRDHLDLLRVEGVTPLHGNVDIGNGQGLLLHHRLGRSFCCGRV